MKKALVTIEKELEERIKYFESEGMLLEAQRIAMETHSRINVVMLGAVLKIMGVEDITIVAGYRNNDIFLKEEMEKYGKLYIATEDGSVGTKGNVMNAIKENNITADEIYTCGPTPMLKAIKEWALEAGIEAQLSLEERMACGIGACLACVCQSKEIDDHSQVHNKRICKDGPVFLAQEVEL